MDVKREALEEFETYHCLHWALLISTESLVLLFSLLLRVILWGKKSQILWWENFVSVVRKPGQVCLNG